ncbi:MAG: nucleotidyltransferase family protein [Opitutaceae bacterium]
MVFAAGLGTRLGPLTSDRPKALVEVDGRPLIDHVLGRLAEAGFTEVIVNLHHFADQVEAWLTTRDSGPAVAISREEVLLDTGGGLKKAAWFFAGEKHFLIHNVDVLSDIDLGNLYRSHESGGPLATLAVMRRKASRYLLIDETGRVCGRRRGEDGTPDLRRAAEGSLEVVGFCGIQIGTAELLERLPPVGRYSITDVYLDLIGEGADIRAASVDGSRWRDCGRPEDLESWKD